MDIKSVTRFSEVPILKHQEDGLANDISSPVFEQTAHEFRVTGHCEEEIFAGEFSHTEKLSDFRLQLKQGDRIFGLGATAGPMEHLGTRRTLWSIDVLGHASCIHDGLESLYATIPFALILREGRAMGFSVNYAGRHTWDIGQTNRDFLQVQCPAGHFDAHLFLGPTPAEVLREFTDVHGRAPMPPRWGLGYQQSRYGYRSRSEVEELAAEFRSRQIPCDVLHLDIHHMHGYRVFTFGKSFPKPSEMLTTLANKGFKVAAIVDPGVKNDPNFPVLKRGRQRDGFVKQPNGRSDFVGKVWPGKSRFPDFFNSGVRRWWAGEQKRFQKLGLAGFWNDMNEPAIFDGPGKTLPEDCEHQTADGPVAHRHLHNRYGTEMAHASFEGALAHNPEARPFIISRSGWLGIQKYAGVWTGDNSSSWEHLANSIPMLLNLGLSGVPFCGADVGGFLGNCSGQLLARWTQLAAFTPFFRNHSNIDSIPQEPWRFGEEVEQICRQYITLRYQLLPYLYCLFAETHQTGNPIMRPLLWHFPNDPKAVTTDDQFLLGQGVLVAPILRKNATARSVYLPSGIWFDFWTGQPFEGGQHIIAETTLAHLPLFLRAGGLIPFAPAEQFIDPEKPQTEITLHAWLGGRGELRWHEDDGATRGYLEGDFSKRTITFVDNGDRGQIRFERTTGKFRSRVKVWRILIRGCDRPITLLANGKKVQGIFDKEIGATTLAVANTPEPFTLAWK